MAIHIVELSGREAETMLDSIQGFDTARKTENEAAKLKDAYKDLMRGFLFERRKINVENLPGKDVVIVKCNGKGGIELKRKESKRLDGGALRAKMPDVADKFTIETVATYFEPLT